MEGGEELISLESGLDKVSDDLPVTNSELPHPSVAGYECGQFLDVIIDERVLSKRALKARADPEFRERERLKNLERTRKLRMDPAFRDKERIKNRISKQRARLDPYYREAERVRNRIQKRKAREDPAYREAERIRNMWQKRRARENPTFRMKERLKDVERKRTKKWGFSRNEDEWMEIGAVEFDEEARIAFEHGLYKVVSNKEGRPWEDCGGPDAWVKSEPPDSGLWDRYFEEQNIKEQNKNGEDPEETLEDNQKEIWTENGTLQIDNGLRGDSVPGSADHKNYGKKMNSLITHSLPLPFISTQSFARDQVYEEASHLDHKNKLKINLNDIEILPLSQKREEKYPNLNWQIEVLRVDKMDKNDKDEKEFITSNQSLDYKKYAKQCPTIQV